MRVDSGLRGWLRHWPSHVATTVTLLGRLATVTWHRNQCHDSRASLSVGLHLDMRPRDGQRIQVS